MSVETFIPPSSSHIESVDYDDESEDLVFKFVSGDSGMYRNVPRATVRAMTQSMSWGGFMHRQLKGRYPYERL